jgi:hypothetical protein
MGVPCKCKCQSSLLTLSRKAVSPGHRKIESKTPSQVVTPCRRQAPLIRPLVAIPFAYSVCFAVKPVPFVGFVVAVRKDLLLKFSSVSVRVIRVKSGGHFCDL